MLYVIENDVSLHLTHARNIYMGVTHEICHRTAHHCKSPPTAGPLMAVVCVALAVKIDRGAPMDISAEGLMRAAALADNGNGQPHSRLRIVNREAFDGALLGQMCSHVAELDDFYSMATREELQEIAFENGENTTWCTEEHGWFTRSSERGSGSENVLRSIAIGASECDIYWCLSPG